MSLKAILIIALLIPTLLPQLPLEPVAAAEQQDQVNFLRSWSIPTPLWKFNEPQSISQLSGAVTFTITPDFCAGAYIGAGWPFQFTGQYPDSIVGESEVGHDPVKMSLDNQITPTSQNLQGCESADNPNLIFDAFAGIKAQVTIDFEVNLPSVPPFPPPPCELTIWNSPVCGPLLLLYYPIKAVYDAAASVFNTFMSVVGSVLTSFGVDLPITIHDTRDFAELGGGPTFMELTWAAQNSPLEQTIGPLLGSIGPFFLNIMPPIISNPGVATVGFGANFVVTPWAGRITGTPHVEGGNIVSTADEGKTVVVGDTSNLGSFENILDLRHQGIPPGNNPFPVSITLENLQQDMSVDVSIQPTITIHVIAWDIDLGLPLQIPLGGISDHLPGTPNLVYQTVVAPALADLSIESVDQIRNKPANYQLSLSVVVKNKGTLSVPPAGYKSFAVYEGTNLLVKIVPYPVNGVLASNQLYSAMIPVPLDKLSSPVRGHHTLKIVVNPDETVAESTYANNEKQYELKVLPDLVPTQYTVNPIAPMVGDTVSISVAVWNTGVVGAPPEGYRSFAVYEENCAGSACFGNLLAKTIYHGSPGSQPDLAPGKDWFPSVWMGKFSQSGDHKITVVVDPEDAVEEYDETNNSITFTINVKAPVTITTVTTVTRPLPPKFDFSINARPSSQSVTPGGSTTYSIVVTLVSGTAQPVTLSVTGLPSGASYSFSLSKGTPSPYFTSTLTVTTSARAPLGTYTLTVVATGGGVTHYTTLQLIVARPPTR